MKIENPFESGHIKNYILAYVSVVVIMVLFFIASTLWRDNEIKTKKEFATKELVKSQKTQETPKTEVDTSSKVLLMPTPYHKNTTSK
jgi:phosphotransferase system  glucose/maltose/N-acetylglucosamine-specific IIC component